MRLIFIATACWAWPSLALADGFSGHFDVQPRAFFRSPIDPQQRRDSISFAVEPKLELSWDSGRQALTASLFGRLDSADSRRTHADIRELNWVAAFGILELEAGVSRVFWGVTESQHLVDVINQTDTVENFDGEQKLGQPLLRVSVLGLFGDLHLYALPYFRQRTFGGSSGRLRLQPRGDMGEAEFQSELEQWQPSAAARWEHSASILDFGLSYFYGTSRDPVFVPRAETLTPWYGLIHQWGFDLQATVDALLLKHESIYRSYTADEAPQPDFYAQTSGIEYTVYAAAGGADLGIILEYLWASQSNFLSPFDNHIFGGVRLGFNDISGTQLLVGGVFDLESPTLFFNLEASRRLSEDLSAALEVRYFRPKGETFLSAFARDSYVQLQIRYGF